MDGKSISSQQLYQSLESAAALVAVSREAAFAAGTAMIVGAVRRSPQILARPAS